MQSTLSVLRKVLRERQRNMARAIALVWDPQHITKIPFALVRNIERQDNVTVRCIRSKKC
jgi:hypothetical protein